MLIRISCPSLAFLKSALALIVALTLGTLGAPNTVGAQPVAKVPRIGVLHPATAATDAHLIEAFKQGLRERGKMSSWKPDMAKPV